MMERSWSEEEQLRLVEVQLEVVGRYSARHAEMRVATWVSEGGKEKSS